MRRVNGRDDESNAIIDASQIESLLDAAGREGVMAILEAFWRSTDETPDRHPRGADRL